MWAEHGPFGASCLEEREYHIRPWELENRTSQPMAGRLMYPRVAGFLGPVVAETRAVPGGVRTGYCRRYRLEDSGWGSPGYRRSASCAVIGRGNEQQARIESKPLPCSKIGTAGCHKCFVIARVVSKSSRGATDSALLASRISGICSEGFLGQDLEVGKCCGGSRGEAGRARARRGGGLVRCSTVAEPRIETVPAEGEEREDRKEGKAGDMAAKDGPKEIFLKDYKPPDYLFDSVVLTFVLGEEVTTVVSQVKVSPRVKGVNAPLVLNGDDLKLVDVKVNGTSLKPDDYELVAKKLVLKKLPSGSFDLEIATEIEPQNNTSLEGLYKSSGNFCTQCEAEGFRKITFFQDRPDVMSIFTTRIEADKGLYPVLLSNGNLVEQGELDGGKHFAVWEDPFPKPSYLFALVAGQLVAREDAFTTRSGRNVVLRIYTPPQDVPKTAHAMRSLKAAMKWDEDVFGLEYDLDLFNIVAVPDFNMGAMENKSLNIFNSKLVLASPETATDIDYASIEGVIGHEYFHNWTGNRVTCRDWFQLSLKEGLTVFRDQEFSSDMGSRTVKRIGDVVKLRILQFPQDAGPMSHPVRPPSYIKMDNFYTVTVYEKGAEVVRMYQTLLGKEGFRKGMDLYFQRHDGQAVTCEDFMAAMFDANKAKFPKFPRWYSQAGTPVLSVTTSYNPDAHTFTLKTSQVIPPTPGQREKEPHLIPVAVGLLDSKGQDLLLSSVSDGGSDISFADSNGKGVTTVILKVENAEHEFVFKNITEKPVPSILRNFSAPVRLKSDVTDEELFFLLAHDSDQFNRWEAGQTLGRKVLLDLISKVKKNEKLSVASAYVEGIRSLLTDSFLDKNFISRAVTLPDESEFIDISEVADPDAIHTARRFLVKHLAHNLRKELLHVVESNRSSEAYDPSHKHRARRSLKNTALTYLASLDEPETTELALREYETAANMTEQFAAMVAIVQNPGDERTQVFSKFYDQWKHEPLVVNKWLALQAASDIPGNVNHVRTLLDHPAFDIRNPNKLYSLVGGFCSSAVNLHSKDGSGYKFLGDITLQVDKLNPQVASRLVSFFSRWRKFDAERQAAAQEQLKRITSTDGLSDNVFEIASKSLSS